MTEPLLSIVIANYNYGRFLEEAIQSVVRQEMGDKVELIICDAGSTDNSVEIVKKYAGGLPSNTPLAEWLSEPSNPKTLKPSNHLITWWCSEKDGGQSAAFNKGFSHARGEWLTWLNADDLLLSGTLRAFERLIRRRPHTVWVTGNMLSFDSESNRILQVNWGPHFQPRCLRTQHAFSAVFGPTTFWKKALYEKIGPIDESLHYAMDTEYWARLTMANVRQTRLNYVCWAFRIHRESKTTGFQNEVVVERRHEETLYWREKLTYNYQPNIHNPWYVIWCIWRIIDGSWFKRVLLKFRYEGTEFNLEKEYK